MTVRRPDGPIRARVELPRSKSVANRALVLAALAGDLSVVHDAGDAEDTRTLLAALRDRPLHIHAGLGGTTLRFLLAWASVQEGEERHITAEARLLERPHDALIDALRTLGADITRVADGFRVRGARLNGGAVTFRSPVSSQYLSALLLIAPCLREGLRITWAGTQLSRPYVEMTARALRHFGAEVRVEDTVISVAPGPLRAARSHVPRDWSAAAFWYELVALATDAEVHLPGLVRDGWQGDEAVGRYTIPWVREEGTATGTVLRSWRDAVQVIAADIDLRATPDLFQPLAFTHAMHGARTTFAGLENLSVKETDRLGAVQQALLAFGITAERSGPLFRLPGRASTGLLAGHVFDPQGDHRMAMALAPLALVCEQVTILHPEVVSKSYPGFWDDLKRAGFMVERPQRREGAKDPATSC